MFSEIPTWLIAIIILPVAYVFLVKVSVMVEKLAASYLPEKISKHLTKQYGDKRNAA